MRGTEEKMRTWQNTKRAQATSMLTTYEYALPTHTHTYFKGHQQTGPSRRQLPIKSKKDEDATIRTGADI